MIGVAGDSASGKATFADGIQQILGVENVTTISLDDYHSMDRRERNQKGVTPLDPRANKMRLMAEHARLLKQGKAIVKPVYNHKNGTFGKPEEVVPTRVVVSTGLLPYMEEEMREIFDFKVFLDPHEELKWKWKLDRDTTTRGYTAHQLNAEVQARRRDFERFVKPQKSYADMVVRSYPATSIFSPQMRIHTLVILKQRNGNGTAQNLAWICHEIAGVEVHNDMDPLVLEIRDEVEGHGIKMIEKQIIDGTKLLGRSHEPDIWTMGGEKTALQICLLLLSWQVLTKLDGFDETVLGEMIPTVSDEHRAVE
jgi:uridine kinase